MSYKNHPAADLFPMMTDAELQELAADIKANRLRHPITTYKNQIIAGRNREKACEIAGVKPEYLEMDFAGESFDPVTFIISSNINRRHLTPDQRADILAALYERKKKQGHRTSGQNAQKLNTRASMAKEGRIPEKKLRAAIHVRKTSPELAAKVRSGDITLAQAKRALPKQVSTAPPDLRKDFRLMRSALARVGPGREYRVVDTLLAMDACDRKEEMIHELYWPIQLAIANLKEMQVRLGNLKAAQVNNTCDLIEGKGAID